MVDIQYDIMIFGGREVSRPYWNWFFAEGERFFMFFVSVPPVFIHRTLLMQLAKYQCIKKHAKGMSLRYGVIVLRNLMDFLPRKYFIIRGFSP